MRPYRYFPLDSRVSGLENGQPAGETRPRQQARSVESQVDGATSRLRVVAREVDCDPGSPVCPTT